MRQRSAGREGTHLKRGVALQVEQRLDHAHVALVDGDVQRSLPPLVAGVLKKVIKNALSMYNMAEMSRCW